MLCDYEFSGADRSISSVISSNLLHVIVELQTQALELHLFLSHHIFDILIIGIQYLYYGN